MRFAEPVRLKIARLQNGDPIRVFDICGGAGGFSLGFQTAGCALIGTIECDSVAAATYALNLHRERDPVQHVQLVRPRDLTLETPSRVAGELGLGPVAEAVDIIIAGLPCQAFARIGRSKLGAIAADKEAYRKDPRASLYRRFLVFVREFVPLAVVLENVPDILNHGSHNVPEEISRELEQAGYRCRYTLLNAVHYGVPQLRERLFLIAVHKSLGAEPTFPVPTHQTSMPPGYAGVRRFALKNLDMGDCHYIHSPEAPPSARGAVTVRQAIGNLPPIVRRGWRISAGLPSRDIRERTVYAQGRPSVYAAMMKDWAGFRTESCVEAHVVRHTPRDYPLFRAMAYGEQYPKLHRRALERFKQEVESRRRRGEALVEGKDDWLALKASLVPPYDPGKFPNKWRKLDPERPSWTLTAHLGKDSYSHIHYDPEQARTISVREAARLQSFPDAFVFKGSMNSAFRQIGNAVPPLLAHAVAMCLVKLLRTAAAGTCVTDHTATRAIA